MISKILLVLCLAFSAHADLRKDSKSRSTAGKAMRHIVKEGKKLPKGASDKADKEIKEICTRQLHRGCYFWEKGSKIYFQPLDNKGEKDGKIYELENWLERLFK